jgi:hypothetical protein
VIRALAAATSRPHEVGRPQYPPIETHVKVSPLASCRGRNPEGRRHQSGTAVSRLSLAARVLLSRGGRDAGAKRTLWFLACQRSTRGETGSEQTPS